ncbi:MAG: sodium:proton antiporter [Clostridiales bacterium]|nr:sodium:proton antiporter [Clostridiales bacterium]
MDFGILTLLPPLIIIVFALWTKRTFESLLLGCVVSFCMVTKTGVLMETVNQLQSTFSDNAWILITMFLLGAFAFMLQSSKGSYSFGKIVRKFAKTEKRNLIIAWLLGILIFMDDFLNILTISSTSLDTCDKQKTPREMLAYVIDSTGAPVCVLIPLSSWAVYFAACMEDSMGDAATQSGMEYYIQSVPFIFYGWAAVIVVPLVILGVIPKVFGMKKAYQRVADGGRVFSDDSAELNLGHVEDSEEEVLDKAGYRLACFFVPIAVIIAVTVVTMDLLVGLVVTLVVMLIMYLPGKILSFGEFCDTFCKGCEYMVGMNLIMLAALTVKVAMDSIALPDYVIGLVLPYMEASTLPVITFVVVSLLSFITGSNWGIPAITFPILIPLALAVGASPVMTLAAIVSGGTFGSHACFYSDATVLTSQCTKIKNLEHAFTQFPYALIAATLAAIAFAISGFVFQ